MGCDLDGEVDREVDCEVGRAVTRRSFLLGSGRLLGAASLAGAAGALLPAPPAGASTYDYRTFSYGAFGSYNPKGQAGAMSSGIPAGSPPLRIDSGTSTLRITAGHHFDLVRFDRRVVIDTTERVVFSRCMFTGPPAPPSTGATPCVDARGPSVNVELYDCEVYAAHTSALVMGISGHDFRAWRCYVHEVTDAFQVFDRHNDNGPADIDIRGCYVTSLSYVTPDPLTADNHTHNDGCEIFGNSTMSLVGNCFEARISATTGQPAADPYYPSSTAQCIAIVNTIGAVSSVTIDRNFLDYGAQSITLIPGPGGTCADITVTNNVFGRHQALIRKKDDPVYRRRAILVDPSCQVNGFPPVTGPDLTCGNVYADDGSPVTIYRLAGG